MHQAVEAVRAAVTNTITHFDGRQIAMENESPGGSYRFPARTREELLESASEVPAKIRSSEASSEEPPVQQPAQRSDSEKTEEGWPL